MYDFSLWFRYVETLVCSSVCSSGVAWQILMFIVYNSIQPQGAMKCPPWSYCPLLYGCGPPTFYTRGQFSVREMDPSACSLYKRALQNPSNRFFAFIRAWMNTKFGSGEENMKQQIITEPDFLIHSFRPCTGVKMNLSGIQTLSASARGLYSGREIFRTLPPASLHYIHT